MQGEITGGPIVRGEVKESTLSAVITRADGTIEDLGIIAHYKKDGSEEQKSRLQKLYDNFTNRFKT